MSFDNWKRWKVTLTVETPIFISSGEEATKLDFVRLKENIFVFDFKNLDKLLLNYGKDARDQFLKAVENGDSLTDILLYRLGIKAGDLRKYASYVVPCALCPGNRGRFKKFIKTLYFGELRPYIPGSSIKGAMRTALAWKLLNKDRTSSEKLKKDLRKLLKKIQEIEGKDEKGTQRLRKKAFVSSNLWKHFERILLRSNNLSGPRSEAQFDILKFVKLSDAYGDSELTITMERVAHLMKNCQWITRKSKRTGKNFTLQNFIEIIEPGAKFQFELSISQAEATSFKEIFGYKTNITINFIQDALREFANAQFIWLDQIKKKCQSAQSSYELADFSPSNSNGEFYLNLGASGGFLSKTVESELEVWSLHSPKEIQKFLSEIYPHKAGNGVFPRTKKLVYWNERWHFPGWVRLKFEEVK